MVPLTMTDLAHEQLAGMRRRPDDKNEQTGRYQRRAVAFAVASNIDRHRGTPRISHVSAKATCPPLPYLGALPVTAACVDISVRGSSTIRVAETFIPFLRSLTDAGLPSTVNLNDSGTL
jgi:hypothetical protein